MTSSVIILIPRLVLDAKLVTGTSATPTIESPEEVPLLPLPSGREDSDDMFSSIDDPLVINYDPSARRKIKQYRAVFLLLSVSCIALAVLLACSIFLGFGCKSHREQSRHARMMNSNMNFFHLSDIHLDIFYSSNTSSSPSFCRDIPNTLNITPVAASYDAVFGRVHCDSPKALLDASVKYMEEVSKTKNGIQFMVLTGENFSFYCILVADQGE